MFFAFGAVGHIPETAERMLVSLIDYAALILGFAGGVHWGLALLPGAVRPSARFGAGVLPLIVAWVGLVLAQMVSPVGGAGGADCGLSRNGVDGASSGTAASGSVALHVDSLGIFGCFDGDDGHGFDPSRHRPDHCILKISGINQVFMIVLMTA